jgi:hypothetical protein
MERVMEYLTGVAPKKGEAPKKKNDPLKIR